MSFPSLTYDPATDRPQEECGVFGVVKNPTPNRLESWQSL